MDEATAVGDDIGQATANSSADRLGADERLRDALAVERFQGPHYQAFERELIRYALSVTRAWLLSGHLFSASAARGRRVGHTEDQAGQLRLDPHLRDSMACAVVATALRAFKRDALEGGGWKAEGGATLTSYFMGRVILEFPNVWRSYRADMGQSEAPMDPVDLEVEALGTPDPRRTPEELLIDSQVMADQLAHLDAETKHLVQLHIEGYRNGEIAEILHLGSARAVEGRLRRWRKNEQARRIGETA